MHHQVVPLIAEAVSRHELREPASEEQSLLEVIASSQLSYTDEFRRDRTGFSSKLHANVWCALPELMDTWYQ